jgi:hypothetical protein
MIQNVWTLGEKDAKAAYRILKKKGILLSDVAGRIMGADLTILSTYNKKVSNRKPEAKE